MRFLYLISISCVRTRDTGPQGQASALLAAYTAGLNWNVNTNVHFMLDWLHGNSVKQISRPTAEMPEASSAHSRCAHRSLPKQPLNGIGRQAMMPDKLQSFER
jgi:hypothetical protein